MKIRIIAASLMLLSSFAVSAHNNNGLETQTFSFPNSLNPSWIRITNKTNNDIAFRIPSGLHAGKVYGIKKGESDTYNFKPGDSKNAVVETGICNKMGLTGSACTDFTPPLVACLAKPIPFKDANILVINTPKSCVLVDQFNW